MDKELAAKEKVLELLKVEDDITGERVSIEEKKAAIKEAKRRYGRDWKKVLGLVGKLRVNTEVMQDLHGMGVGGKELREMSKPKGIGRGL